MSARRNDCQPGLLVNAVHDVDASFKVFGLVLHKAQRVDPQVAEAQLLHEGYRVRYGRGYQLFYPVERAWGEQSSSVRHYQSNARCVAQNIAQGDVLDLQIHLNKAPVLHVDKPEKLETREDVPDASVTFCPQFVVMCSLADL